MRALSIYQPWASLVVLGGKRFETRSWSTDYRGPLAIHASKKFPAESQRLCVESPFLEFFEASKIDVSGLPRGAIIGTVTLVNVFQTEHVQSVIDERERAFGDFGRGRFAWELANYHACRPIPASGALGLWHWESSL